MQSIAKRIKGKSIYSWGFIAVLVLSSTTAIAMAAIPDTSGIIHGCRANSNGSVRVIDDASQQCKPNETVLNGIIQVLKGFKVPKGGAWPMPIYLQQWL